MITCPVGDTEGAPGFAFCPRCERRLPSPCAACGFACEPHFSFCPRGGAARGPTTPVTPAPPQKPADPSREADRRPVTVLFADLSGFTTLSERLDPEDVPAFQNTRFEERSP